MVENLPGSAGDSGSISGLGRSPGVGNGNPTPVFLPGKSHGERSLVGYSPRGPQESDMTEQLITRMHALDVKRRGFEESLVAKGLHTG